MARKIITFGSSEDTHRESFQLKKKLINHVHSFYELYVFLGGNDIIMTLENSLYELRAGDIFLIHPTQYHQILPGKNFTSYKRFIYHFYISGDDTITSDFIKSIKNCNYTMSFEIQSVVERILKYEKELPESEYLFMREGLANELMLALSKNSIGKNLSTLKINSVISEAINYINGHLKSRLTLTLIANACSVHPNYLSRLFPQVMGIKLMDYVRAKQLMLAHELIKDGYMPTKVFRECGFEDYSNFARCYNSYFGHYPAKDKSSSCKTTKLP